MGGRVKKRLVWLSFISLILWCVGQRMTLRAHAEEGIGFSYYNKTPKNQVSEGSYFDLLVKPKGQQTLVTEIRNESTETITITISISDSKTTGTGVIEYGPSQLINTKNLVYKLSDILTGPSEVKLKKGEVKEVKFNLNVPEKSFEGVILGGIQLEKTTKKSENEGADTIRNKYAYAFSVSLRENDQKLPYRLNSERVTYLTNEELGQVAVSVSNDSQEIVKEMTLSTVITAEESDEVIAESLTDKMKMAPMSVMDYLIEFPNAEPGRYLVKTKAVAGDQEWNWETKFDLTKEEIEAPKVVKKTPKKVNYLGIMTLIVTIIVGLVFAVSLIQSYRKK